ncbi:MAG: PD40 domain-containing protein [Bacteroidetes bacterium]|nr:PD40 domain-containing protein [Bacteroidota bacterium]
MRLSIYSIVALSLVLSACSDRISTPTTATGSERIVYSTLDYSRRDLPPHLVCVDSSLRLVADQGIGYGFDAGRNTCLWITRDTVTLRTSFAVYDDRSLMTSQLGDLTGAGERSEDQYPSAISPDGSHIAIYMHDTANDLNKLYVVDVRTRQRVLITDKLDVQAHTCFSPDGNRIAYYTQLKVPPDQNEVIAISTIDASQRVTLTAISDAGVDGFASISWSDKDRIAFVDASAVYVINADGSGRIQVASPAFSPAWSPTGDTLAITASNSSDVMITSDNGITITNLTNSDGVSEAFAHWSNDGKRLLVTKWIGDMDHTIMTLEEIYIPTGDIRVIASPGANGFYLK